MPKTKSGTISKAAFVRSLPSHTPAKEVTAKAKSAGLTITEAYVYNVRATSKPKKNGVRRASAVAVQRQGGRGAEDLLRALAAEIGVSRALSILQAQRASLRAILGS
jgi:hypothetical protein